MNGLTAARTALEARSDRWLHVMVVATVLVAIGVVIEVWATILEVRDERRKGAKIEWHHILTFIGAILVAAFVGLECIAEYKGGDIETKLREKNGEIEQVLTKEADDAETSAKEAADAASRANDQAGRAKDRADSASEQAAELRSFMIKLADAFRQPSLTTQQIKDMSDEMRPFADPHIPITIITTEGAPIRLALQIAAAIEGAGFSRPTLDIRTATTPEISMGGPLDPPHWKAMLGIEGPIVKRLGLWGVLQVLPAGSPIMINVGEHITGEIPQLPPPRPHN